MEKMNFIKKDNEHLYLADKSLIIYEIIKNIFISFLIILILSLVYFFYAKNIFLILIILTILGVILDVYWSFRTVKYSMIYINEHFLTIREGNIFKKKSIIPLEKIYMITTKNNILLDKLDIMELKIRTLADNHSFTGLKKSDYMSFMNTLCKKTKIKSANEHNGDIDEG